MTEIRCVKYVHQLGEGRWRVTFTDGTTTNRARLLAAVRLGRPVARDEVVHHRNGDCSDDSLDNLEVLSHADHARWHGENPDAHQVPAGARHVKMNLRAPDELIDRLRVEAEKNGRSLNGEIAYRLRMSVEGYRR